MSQNDYVVMKKPDLEPVMYKGKDLNDVVFTILSAVQDVSVVKYFGVNVLLDVLRGVRTKKIDDAKLYEVPEFGALKESRTIWSGMTWTERRASSGVQR